MDATLSAGEPTLLISRSALWHNVRLIRRQLAAGVGICAVVKADAYGHGAQLVVDALRKFTPGDSEADHPCVDRVAFASMDEAAQVAQPDCPVHILRPIEGVYVSGHREAIEHAIRNGWILSVLSVEAANDLARLAQRMGMRARVGVMIDTGMTRCGAPPALVPALLDRIRAHAAIKLVSLSTHFVSSERRGDERMPSQLAQFLQLTSPISSEMPGRLVRHAANSAAVFAFPRAHLDLVRPGLALYGIEPSGRPNLSRPLRPVLKWVAPLVAIHDVNPGTTVGYGGGWRASRLSRIGLIPVGYADGYSRRFSGSASVIVQGKPAPVVGAVSMDLTTIDLTDLPEARVGDVVTLLDSDPLSPASVYELARIDQTIPYEIVARLGARLRRVPVDPADLEVPEMESEVD